MCEAIIRRKCYTQFFTLQLIRMTSASNYEYDIMGFYQQYWELVKCKSGEYIEHFFLALNQKRMLFFYHLLMLLQFSPLFFQVSLHQQVTNFVFVICTISTPNIYLKNLVQLKQLFISGCKLFTTSSLCVRCLRHDGSRQMGTKQLQSNQSALVEIVWR